MFEMYYKPCWSSFNCSGHADNGLKDTTWFLEKWFLGLKVKGYFLWRQRWSQITTQPHPAVAEHNVLGSTRLWSS